ncbi:MAG: FtsX-like permease family protein [Spirosomataceae bacterium]
MLINETAAKEMGFNQPLGKTISLMGKDNLQIIGVIKDFHFQTLYEPIRPLVVRFMEKPSPLLVAKLKAGSEKGTLEGMKTLYNQFNPNVAFDYEFLDEQYNRLYTSEQKVSTLASFFAITSIIISCLGLLGLVIFMVIKKRKEIIIRRIHGASVPQVVQLLTKEFLYLVGTGLLISFPVSYFFSKKWLDSFVYHVDLQWIVFVLVGFFSIAIAFLTVGYHAYKAAHTNPAESLKIE